MCMQLQEMSSNDLESCDWESETGQSIGSECEWSSEDSIQFINSTPVTKRPKIQLDLKITTPANGVGFNSSIETCDWSACELNSTFDSVPFTPVHLQVAASKAAGSSAGPVAISPRARCPTSDGIKRHGLRRSPRKFKNRPSFTTRSPSPKTSRSSGRVCYPRRSPRKSRKRLSFSTSPPTISSPPKAVDTKPTYTINCRQRKLSFSSEKFYQPAVSPPSRNTSFLGKEETWSLFDVMGTHGCENKCVPYIHNLTEYDVLSAHSSFTAKTPADQRKWLFDYLATHCPNNEFGLKEPKKLTYHLCGKNVCLPVWLAVLSISSSRFYEVRREFMDGMIQPAPKRSRSLAVKSQQAIAWMESYFDRIGDKRPDKDGIYLPTCLTEKAIYDKMVEELQERVVCFSQFNKIFRKSFSHVSIPKVFISAYIQYLTCILLYSH